jgi:polyphosphate kinase
LLPEFEKLIEAEIKKAAKGLPALIRIKVNNLEEPYFINLLYKAAEAGVQIQLIVRSICCLWPDTEILRKNISMKRIVDQFLEHTRIFIFGIDANATVAMGSSDLMTRNLRRRIEVCLHVKDEAVKAQLIDYFRIQWNDNTKSTILDGNMDQKRVPQGTVPLNAQHLIYDYVKKISI